MLWLEFYNNFVTITYICVCMRAQVQFFNYLLDMNNCIMHEFTSGQNEQAQKNCRSNSLVIISKPSQLTVSKECESVINWLFFVLSLSYHHLSIDNNMCVICTKLFIYIHVYMSACTYALTLVLNELGWSEEAWKWPVSFFLIKWMEKKVRIDFCGKNN